MIEIDSLTKDFGGFRAVDGLSLTVPRGEVLGFLGPNGAGKSTTMKMVTGFLRPTSGSAAVCGYDIQQDRLAAQRCIGYLPEGAPAWPEMTVEAMLRFAGTARGMEKSTLGNALGQAMDRTELAAVAHQPIETLSKGFRRRVGLALALLHNPDVLILDEPTDGLDPNQKHGVRRLIADIAADKAIVVSTHILEEVEAVCTRAVIIDQGRLIADGTPSELEARDPLHGAVRLTVDPGERGSVIDAISAAIPDAFIDPEGTGALIIRPGAHSASDVAAALDKANIRTGGFTVLSGRLDAVFRTITQTEDRQ